MSQVIVRCDYRACDEQLVFVLTTPAQARQLAGEAGWGYVDAPPEGRDYCPKHKAKGDVQRFEELLEQSSLARKNIPPIDDGEAQ